MRLAKLTKHHYEEIEELVSGLHRWFDKKGRAWIPIDIRYNDGIVAIDDKNGHVIGFACYHVADGGLVIGWLGVKKELHGNGIGTSIVNKLREICGKHGLRKITTFTLGDSVKYEPYRRTREFYYKMGFKVYQRAFTDNKSCPEEIRLRLDI